jgi:succinate dehydrogenase / fumarate reductase cytochrome b subunit
MNRPLSPHLQIYRPAMTMVMSIAHRLSGVALYGIVLCLVAWLNLLAFTPHYFNLVQSFLSTNQGQIILFLALWVFCHHLFGGVRHFLWDLGFGLGIYGREWLTWGCFILGVLSALGLFFAPDYEIILRRLN